MSEQEHAGGGGAAPAPRIETSGPAPSGLPAELAALLPEGFELPPGFVIIEIPEPTPEELTWGAVEHASMQRGLYEAGLRDLDVTREHAAGMIASHEEGVERLRVQAEEAEQRARDLAAEHGITLPSALPRATQWDTADDTEGSAE